MAKHEIDLKWCPYTGKKIEIFPYGSLDNATKYPELQKSIGRNIHNDIQPIMSSCIKSFIQTASIIGLEDGEYLGEYWSSSVSKSILDMMGMDYGAYKPEEVLRRVATYKSTPDSWKAIITEGGILSNTQDRLIAILKEVDRTYFGDIDTIKVICKKHLYQGRFEGEFGKYKVHCMGKALTTSILTSAALNYTLAKIDRGLYIEPLDENGNRKSERQLFEEYEAIIS